MDAGLKTILRLYVRVLGAVQGVGFRPFVFRLASELGLTGFVRNTLQGVEIEVEGTKPALDVFLVRLGSEAPPNSAIYSVETVRLDPIGYTEFRIDKSGVEGRVRVVVLPDLATCSECLRELFDPADRRYRYPFINCTHCGPRYSIIERLPYDRQNTSMKRFQMCPACKAEFEDPRNRRFHAQPNACWVCGPRPALWDAAGRELASGYESILGAVAALREGRVVAVKGLGGFHLMVLAGVDAAVARLRERKRRGRKPFALMFPSLEQVREVCAVSELEARLLGSVEAPIVLLRRHTDSGTGPVSPLVAPRNPWLGVMLPYTPLHHLLMRELGTPVVATSGNLSEEPICIDEGEALVRLRGVADVFLVHDRPIVRHVDDSIVRIMGGREVVLRRARGFAPLSIPVQISGSRAARQVLAVGAHLKNTVAVCDGTQVYLSQHVGDLETAEAVSAFERVVGDLCGLYGIAPEVVVRDLHPGYRSSVYADNVWGRSGTRVYTVQHHVAHVLGCMQENRVAPPALGVAWDGTGYGADGAVWGGEFFMVTKTGIERVGTFRRFRLPGGDVAVRAPWRVALAVLYECFGGNALRAGTVPWPTGFPAGHVGVVLRMLETGVNSPACSSVGRLFDAVSSLLGLCHEADFEGEAAMALEHAAAIAKTSEPYQFRIEEAVGNPQADAEMRPWSKPRDAARMLVVDWRDVIRRIVSERMDGMSVPIIAAGFHRGLADAIAQVARRLGVQRVVLCGGCFQNQLLIESAVNALSGSGCTAYWSQRVPPNDGGIAFGQAVAALRFLG